MPRMKGTRLAASFRELRPDVPIIIMTGFNSGLAPEAMRLSGLAGPLQKPFTSDSLLALVSDTLRRPPRVRALGVRSAE